MSNNYLREFVIGSSFLIFFPYFLVVYALTLKNKTNYQFSKYVFIAPFVLGMMNVFSLLLANTFGFNTYQRYLVASFLAPTVVAIFSYVSNAYKFTSWQEWSLYFFILYLGYFVMFNLILKHIDESI